MAVMAVVVQLKDGQGVLVRVDLNQLGEGFEGDAVQVDYRPEQVASWTPVSALNSFNYKYPKYRVEMQ